MNRTAISICLLISLAAPLATTWGYLQHQKRLVRREVKRSIMAGIAAPELVLLKFSAHDLQTQLRWEHDREFAYQGQMYDVVEKKVQGDTTYFWCWWDHAETALNQQLDTLVAKALDSSPQRKNCTDKLIHFFKNLFCSSGATPSFFPLPHRPQPRWYPPRYYPVFYDPPTPPPRMV